MSGFRFTPSAGPRLEKCPGSAVLPNVNEEWESANRGRALHSYLEALALGTPRPAALASVPDDWRKDAERIDVPEDIDKGRPEMGLALNLSDGTARVLGERMTRESVKAALLPEEIGMVPDWTTIADGVPVVRDWKMGWQEDLGAAADHLQLLAYVATTLLALGSDRARGELHHWDGVCWRVDSVEMDWLAAQAVLDRVRALLDRMRDVQAEHATTGALPRLSVGAWCSWCPAQRACPALSGGLLALVEGQPLDMTPERLGQAYRGLLVARARLDKMLEDVRTLATQTPIPLEGGKVLRLEEVARTSIDVEKALPVLVERYGERLASAAVQVKRSIPWEALRDALRTEQLPELAQAHNDGRMPGRKPTLAALDRDARALLEAMGAVEVKTHTQLREVVPQLTGGEES